MKIKFQGEVELDEVPDDRGSVDNYLIAMIDCAVHADTDEVFRRLNLTWQEQKEEEGDAPEVPNESKPGGLSK